MPMILAENVTNCKIPMNILIQTLGKKMKILALQMVKGYEVENYFNLCPLQHLI